MDNSEFDYSYQYNNWHNDSEKSKKTDIQSAKKIFSTHGIFPMKKSDKVLEIGCGMGRFMLMLKEEGYDNISGLDIDKSQIEIAKKEGLDVYLSDAIEWLQNTEEKFDVIYFFDVMEHISKEKQLTFLRLIHEHLNESGMIALSVPNALSPTAMFFRYIDFTHTVSYTEITLKFLLCNSGFKHMQVRPQQNESRRIMKLKMPWVNIYREEFGLKDFILTPNLISVAFKNNDAFQNYIEKAPIIKNSYKESQFARFLRHLRKMKF